MDRDGLPTAFGAPRNRSAQRPVDLAHAGPVAVARERALRYRLGMASPARSRSWRGVTSSTTARAAGRSSSRFTRRPRLDAPAERHDLGHEGVDDGRAPALDDRPAVAMGHGREEPGEDARERRRERAAWSARRCRPRAPAPPRSGTSGPCVGRTETPQPERRRPPGGGRGAERMEPRKAGRILSTSRTSGEKIRAYAGPSFPSESATSSTLCPTHTARPPSSGWAKATRRRQQPHPVGRRGRCRGRRGTPTGAGEPPSKRRDGIRGGSVRPCGSPRPAGPPPRRRRRPGRHGPG